MTMSTKYRHIWQISLFSVELFRKAKVDLVCLIDLFCFREEEEEEDEEEGEREESVKADEESIEEVKPKIGW